MIPDIFILRMITETGERLMSKKSTRLEALHSTFEENGISPENIMVNDTLIREIKQYADTVPDYLHPSYTKHLLGDIIMIVFFAILGNANEWGRLRALPKKGNMAQKILGASLRNTYR